MYGDASPRPGPVGTTKKTLLSLGGEGYQLYSKIRHQRTDVFFLPPAPAIHLQPPQACSELSVKHPPRLVAHRSSVGASSPNPQTRSDLSRFRQRKRPANPSLLACAHSLLVAYIHSSLFKCAVGQSELWLLMAARGCWLLMASRGCLSARGCLWLLWPLWLLVAVRHPYLSPEALKNAPRSPTPLTPRTPPECTLNAENCSLKSPVKSATSPFGNLAVWQP